MASTANQIALAVIKAGISQVLGLVRCTAIKGGLLVNHPLTRLVIEIVT